MSQTQAVTAAAAGTVTLGGTSPSTAWATAPCASPAMDLGPPADKAAALATLRRAVELGVNFIDTADSYGPNVSEELIAEALYPYPETWSSPPRADGSAAARPVDAQRQPQASDRSRRRQS